MTARKISIMAMVLFFAILTIGVAPMAMAQGTNVEKPPVGGPRRQLGTIIYAGLGGAVLGLSTLSFYGRPQDKLANIAIGFAVGVIAGTVAVTYSAATNPDEFYGSQPESIDPMNTRVLGPAATTTVLAGRGRVGDDTSTISGSFQILNF